jgi:hypothetical protein
MSDTDRNSTIKAIKAALQRRSGKAWSVTGGRGTAWGWIHVTAPPSRRTWGHREKPGTEGQYFANHADQYEEYDTGTPDRNMSPSDRAELGELLGLDRKSYDSGESIAASYEYYREYIDRAEGRTPAKIAEPYWD